MDPRDMAPVTNRFTISFAGSTSSNRTEDLSNTSGRHRKTPRNVLLAFTSSTSRQYDRNVSLLFDFVAACKDTMPMGVFKCTSPPFR